MKKIFPLFSLLPALLCAGCSTPIEKKTFPPMTQQEIEAVFGQDMKKVYPEHVIGSGVVRGEVTAKNESIYCPMRTALCGENPRCDHPKRSRTNYTIRLNETLWKSSDAVNIPAEVTSVFVPEPLESGDWVTLSLYIYKNTPAQVSKIIRR